jgi:hypothetical protein
VAAAAALIVAAGWNAGPGSPLHPIQQAREEASLALATAHQAGALRLDYAEARLRDAASGTDRSDSITEARALLDATPQDLPTDHRDPLWLRWSLDETVLAGLLAAPLSPTPSTSAPASGHDDGASGPGDATGQGPGRDRGGNHENEGSPIGGGTSPTAKSDGGSNSGPESGPGPTPESSGGTATGGGGGDGSGSGGGGPATPASPTPDDGGGGGTAN